MKGAVIIAHASKDDENAAPTIQARRLESEYGIRTRCASVGKDSDLEATLRALASEGVDEIAIVQLVVAADMLNPTPIPEDKLPKGPIPGLPEGMKMPKYEPVKVPEYVEADGRKVGIKVCGPFGPEPGMREVMGSIVERMGADRDGSVVIVVGHGSFDGSNQRAVEANVGHLRDMGYQAMACYNEICEPTVERTLEEALGSGRGDILVIPLFVSPSMHSSVEIPEKLGLEKGSCEREVPVDGRTVRIRYASEVGLEPILAKVLRDMIEG